MNAERRIVHVRVNDAATGQPTPVRIHFSSPGGEYFAPLGRLTEFACEPGVDVGGNLLSNGRKYAYIDGTCEIQLPPGPVRVAIHKGFEYRPQFLEVPLGAGQMTLRFQIERALDARRERWYSGDCRAHMLTPHAALLEGAAEDLAVVNLLIAETNIWAFAALERHLVLEKREQFSVSEVPQYKAIPNMLAFSGQQPALSRPGHLVVVNTYNWRGELGSLGLLNCHRPVFPLDTSAFESPEEWLLADWADQCHRKRGLVVWTNFGIFDYRIGPDRFYGAEHLADLLLGKIDTLEVQAGHQGDDNVFRYWAMMLGCGCRLPLVGSSGKWDNTIHLGCRRTYARLRADEELSYHSWIEAVRAGRTFITNGPLLFLTVNGQDPGEVIDLPSLDQPVEVRLDVRSLVPFDEVELVMNDRVLRALSATGETLHFHESVRVPSTGWLATRCRGRHRLDLGDGDMATREAVHAQTSPVYIRVQGTPAPVDARHAAELRRHLRRLSVSLKDHMPFAPHGHRRMLALLRDARAELVRRRKA
jgi:hypothetical protein